MSYYLYASQLTDAGLPGWQFAPEPGWQSNPKTDGPRRIAIGCPCGVGQEAAEDKGTSKLVIGLLVGAVIAIPIGIAWASSKKKRNANPTRPRLGSGARFRRLQRKLEERSCARRPHDPHCVREPRALAASIGRRRYGKRRYQRMAQLGRARSA